MEIPAARDRTPGKRAVVLLSGGLDSAVALAWARHEGYVCHALTVDYGQRHRLEVERARQIAQTLGAQAHKVLEVDLRAFGGSALTADGPMPAARLDIGGSTVPATYVPARNTILLSLALAWAEVLRADAIFIGANAVDYSGYPDCRPEYLAAFTQLTHLATKAATHEGWAVRLEAPLLRYSKGEIVRLGQNLGVPFALTNSCYNPSSDGRPCGVCEACRLRAKGFAEAGIEDPVRRN
jgi:7-cyano-7-deazaguanine synthase